MQAIDYKNFEDSFRISSFLLREIANEAFDMKHIHLSNKSIIGLTVGPELTDCDIQLAPCQQVLSVNHEQLINARDKYFGFLSQEFLFFSDVSSLWDREMDSTMFREEIKLMRVVNMNDGYNHKYKYPTAAAPKIIEALEVKFGKSLPTLNPDQIGGINKAGHLYARQY